MKSQNFLSFYLLLVFFSLLINPLRLYAEEMILGEEIISEGMKIVFEAAPKDIVYPKDVYLDESQTDIHIEMLINWSEGNKRNSPGGGFIPYLNVFADISNKNGNTIRVELTPHLNISDNFHYAQNIKLPGKIDDIYDVIFEINPPEEGVLGIHYDWKQQYQQVMNKKIFKYQNLNFEKIALKSRR